MRKKGAAVVQRNGGWYGLTVTVLEKGITDLRLHFEGDLTELKKAVAADGYGLALENSAAYLFNLTFPFSEKGKIRLVIGSELEERLPLAMEDLAVDFVQSAKGSVLAAAIPRSLSEDLRTDKRLRITTIQAIAVLHALKWFNIISEEDFVFVHMNGNGVVVMGFKDSRLYCLRQFVYLPESDALHDALREIINDQGFAPRSYVMVSDNEDAPLQRMALEQAFGIRVEIPLLKDVLKDEEAPEWLWPAVGTALLSVRPKGQLNLTGERNSYFFPSFFPSPKGALSISAGLASLSLLVGGLFFLDYCLKERTYQYLVSEPARIYRITFPKSPPTRDPVRMFREKIRLLGAEPGSVAPATSPLAVLNEISTRIGPEVDVKVNEFASDEKEFTLSGTTVSFASVEKIKAALEQMKGVSQVEVQNLDLAANKQVKFKLRGRL